MIRVTRLVYASFDTAEIERQIEYYTEILGLTLTGRDRHAAYLASTVDHHSVVLRPGKEPRCTHLGFQVPPEAGLESFERQVSGHGIKTARQSDPNPATSELLTFTDVKGTNIEVFSEATASTQPFQSKGVVPVKLGHLAYNTPEVQKSVDFYCGVLGFRFSDSIEDFFVFLRCNADHHAINLVAGKRTKMHHIAFELRDWGHMQTACDYLSMNGYPLIWGPGRHGLGHNLFCYHRNPDGQIVELFAELDRMNEELGSYEPRPWHRERPQKPKVWPNEVGASNLWGIMPTPDFLD